MQIFWLGYIGLLVIIFFKFLNCISDSLIDIKNELKRMNKKE